MDSEDGQVFVKAREEPNLAHFIRTHEKALANALQLRRQGSNDGHASPHVRESSPTQINGYQSSTTPSSTSSTFAAVLSLGSLNFASQNLKPAKLAMTSHHLYYLLDRFEEIGIPIGPMNVRLENIHTEASPANYVSFLSQPSQRAKGRSRSDRDSIHSVSSVRSVVSSISTLWSSIGLGASPTVAKTEKAKAQMSVDLKYLYSAFTKIPCLRLSPDHNTRPIGGYEEFPFDTAVPLLAFKNLSALEISDVDFRQFYGWDKLAEQLRSLALKRASLADPGDLLVNIVLDDMDRRRRRSSRAQSSPGLPWPSSPSLRFSDLGRSNSTPSSPMVDEKMGQGTSPKNSLHFQREREASVPLQKERTESTSPSRPSSSRQDGAQRHARVSTPNVKRSGSGSSNSSTLSSGPNRSGSSSNLLSMGILPASKWRFLKHLSLADNSLTSMTAFSLAPLANTLHSLDLSSNLFTEMPDCLAALSALRALNVSNCMIESLHSLTRNPLPAITALNLRANRIASLAGVERLLSLERLDLRDNKLQDPTELARLTSTPNIHEVWVLRNPFVKTQCNYRITIFNLFRNTPGYSEDLVIDTSGPGYSERKQLKDRIIEPEGLPVFKHKILESEEPHQATANSAIVARESGVKGAGIEKAQRPIARETQSEYAVGSGRRRKGPRRRIVDLACEDSSPIIHQTFAETLHDSDYHRPVIDAISPLPKTKSTLLPPLGGPLGLSSQSPLSSNAPALCLDQPGTEISKKGRNLATEIQKRNLNGEAYRQKIEALKDEVGSNWLSVLSEQSWNDHRKSRGLESDIDHVGLLKSEVRSGIISGNRTLG